jgi:hypothetical protein
MPKKPQPKKKKFNGEPPKAFRKFIEDSVQEIKEQCGLTDYDILFEYSNKVIHGHQENRITQAQVDVDTKYLNAVLTIFPPLLDAYKDGRKEFIKMVLCHELAHIRTDPLTKAAKDRWACPSEIDDNCERLTEILGRLMATNIYLVNKQKKKTKK